MVLLKVRSQEHGQALVIINMGDGILLKPKKPFKETTLEQVAGCLKYEGKAKTIEEMNEAIEQEIKELYQINMKLHIII
jgi:hypothetical protein